MPFGFGQLALSEELLRALLATGHPTLEHLFSVEAPATHRECVSLCFFVGRAVLLKRRDVVAKVVDAREAIDPHKAIQKFDVEVGSILGLDDVLATKGALGLCRGGWNREHDGQQLAHIRIPMPKGTVAENAMGEGSELSVRQQNFESGVADDKLDEILILRLQLDPI